MEILSRFSCVFIALCVLRIGAQECPSECSCKWKSGRKTVECVDRGLIMVPLGIAVETQVLDVSGNDLQILHRDTFHRSGLINLQKMYMRGCRLGQIDRNAFRGLTNLIEIDLSNNLLTYVPSQTFSDLQYLRNISLAQNPIQKVDPFAFRDLPNLIRLDLSFCKIQSVRPKAFDGLNSLQVLKLNDNQLTELQSNTVDTLSNIKSIELHGNNWICDCHLRATRIWMTEYNVNVPKPLFCVGGPERLKDKLLLELEANDFACTPSIKNDVRNIEVVLGGNITVECRVESDPVATINWYFGNGMLLSNNSIYSGSERLFILESDDNVYDKRSKLVLKRVEESDAGQYHCVAENRAGNDEANFTLFVMPAVAGITISTFNVNIITIALAVLIVMMLFVIVILVKRIKRNSYPDDPVKSQPEKDSESQRSHDSEIKSESGKAFTVTSDLSYSRSLSDIGNPAFSNPDLINGTTRDSTCVTPLPITRPISDYCQNWQKSYAPRATSSSGFSYDPMMDRMMVDTASAGSGSDDVFHTRMEYPPDYGLPILPENGITPPCAKTLKVWQRGVPVYPPMCSGPPVFQTLPPIRSSPADNRRPSRCGTDV